MEFPLSLTARHTRATHANTLRTLCERFADALTTIAGQRLDPWTPTFKTRTLLLRIREKAIVRPQMPAAPPPRASFSTPVFPLLCAGAHLAGASGSHFKLRYLCPRIGSLPVCFRLRHRNKWDPDGPKYHRTATDAERIYQARHPTRASRCCWRTSSEIAHVEERSKLRSCPTVKDYCRAPPAPSLALSPVAFALHENCMNHQLKHR